MTTVAETINVEKVYVPAADDMDLETFCLHMTHRHADSLGGLAELDPERLDNYLEECYRSFHDKLHELRPDARGNLVQTLGYRVFDHEHRSPR